MQLPKQAVEFTQPLDWQKKIIERVQSLGTKNYSCIVIRSDGYMSTTRDISAIDFSKYTEEKAKIKASIAEVIPLELLNPKNEKALQQKLEKAAAAINMANQAVNPTPVGTAPVETNAATLKAALQDFAKTKKIPSFASKEAIQNNSWCASLIITFPEMASAIAKDDNFYLFTADKDHYLGSLNNMFSKTPDNHNAYFGQLVNSREIMLPAITRQVRTIPNTPKNQALKTRTLQPSFLDNPVSMIYEEMIHAMDFGGQLKAESEQRMTKKDRKSYEDYRASINHTALEAKLFLDTVPVLKKLAELVPPDEFAKNSPTAFAAKIITEVMQSAQRDEPPYERVATIGRMYLELAVYMGSREEARKVVCGMIPIKGSAQRPASAKNDTWPVDIFFEKLDQATEKYKQDYTLPQRQQAQKFANYHFALNAASLATNDLSAR